MLKNKIMRGCFIFVMTWGMHNPLYAEKQLFTIGWEPWKPYQYINANNQLTGLDVELVQAIFKKMNCKLNYKNIFWKSLLSAIRRGKIDLAASASKSSQRKTYAHFSTPYRKEENVIFVLKGRSQKFPLKKLSDIAHFKFLLGITNGYFYCDSLEKLMKQKKFSAYVQSVKKDEMNITKTLKQRIDGFVCDQYAGIAMIKKANALDRFEIHPLKVSSSDIHVMFSKKSCTLSDVKRFNNALKLLQKNNALESIIVKYIGNI